MLPDESPFANLHAVDVNEQVEIMEQAMKKLDDEESLLLEMFYRHDCSVEDISSVTGLSVSNVKVKLFRTRKKLLLLMNSRGTSKSPREWTEKVDSRCNSKSPREWTEK